MCVEIVSDARHFVSGEIESMTNLCFSSESISKCHSPLVCDWLVLHKQSGDKSVQSPNGVWSALCLHTSNRWMYVFHFFSLFAASFFASRIVWLSYRWRSSRIDCTPLAWTNVCKHSNGSCECTQGIDWHRSVPASPNLYRLRMPVCAICAAQTQPVPVSSYGSSEKMQYQLGYRFVTRTAT